MGRTKKEIRKLHRINRGKKKACQEGKRVITSNQGFCLSCLADFILANPLQKEEAGKLIKEKVFHGPKEHSITPYEEDSGLCQGIILVVSVPKNKVIKYDHIQDALQKTNPHLLSDLQAKGFLHPELWHIPSLLPFLPSSK